MKVQVCVEDDENTWEEKKRALNLGGRMRDASGEMKANDQASRLLIKFGRRAGGSA